MVGGDGGDTFLVNLSTLWEDAIRRMADEWARRAGWIQSADRTRRWDDERQIEDPARWLTVDALLRSPNGCCIVLDAKYKRAFGTEARNDRFQMAAYCLAFGAMTSCLAYPVSDDASTDTRLLLRSSLVGAPAEIRSLALPMAAGPLKCAETLEQQLNELADRKDIMRTGVSTNATP
jgi:5-methylcytosine-specific restriction endonuclease McrBC regulatory subunit McrC